MRTSVNPPDSLFEVARERAQQEGRSVASLVEEALRDLLECRVQAHAQTTLPTWGGGPLLIDLDDKDAVSTALGADGPG